MGVRLDKSRKFGTVFGDEVPHAHVWLVPRHDGDGHGGSLDLKNVKDIDEEEMKKIQEKLQKILDKI